MSSAPPEWCSCKKKKKRAAANSQLIFLCCLYQMCSEQLFEEFLALQCAKRKLLKELEIWNGYIGWEKEECSLMCWRCAQRAAWCSTVVRQGLFMCLWKKLGGRVVVRLEKVALWMISDNSVLGKKISTWKPNEVFCMNVFGSNFLGNLTWKTPIGTAPLASQIAEGRINFCSKYPA